jgi:hypothetical protein
MKKFGLLLWDELLREVIELYFSSFDSCQCEDFDVDMSFYSHDLILKIKKIDYFIIEALRPDKFRDAAGFRFAKTLVKGRLNSHPILIFKALEKKFLNYPCFIDYGTVHLLPEKLEKLSTSGRDIENHFLEIVKQYPYLEKLPIHKKVV